MSRSQRLIVGLSRSANLSRRSFLASSTALGATNGISLERDQVLPDCEAWLERRSEYDTLSRRAEALESFLVQHCHWHQLSHRLRAAIPQAIELDTIEDRRDELQTLNEVLLARIPTIAATTAQGVIAKLAVVIACLPREEHDPVHALLRSALIDLQSLAGARLCSGYA